MQERGVSTLPALSPLPPCLQRGQRAAQTCSMIFSQEKTVLGKIGKYTCAKAGAGREPPRGLGRAGAAADAPRAPQPAPAHGAGTCSLGNS